jgi:hypothetical protein
MIVATACFARETPSSQPDTPGTLSKPLLFGLFFRTIQTMKVPLRVLLWFLLVLLLMSTTGAKGNRDNPPIGKDRIPYKRLTWNDFRVNDTAKGLSAQTQTFLEYRYSARAVRTPYTKEFIATITRIEFHGGFDRSQSWRRSTVKLDNTLLLGHEQGHLDINELKLRQLRSLALETLPSGKAFSAKAALADLDRKLKKTFQWHLDDLARTQKRYDEETAFGTITELQEQWATNLQNALQRTVATNTPIKN